MNPNTNDKNAEIKNPQIAPNSTIVLTHLIITYHIQTPLRRLMILVFLGTELITQNMLQDVLNTFYRK